MLLEGALLLAATVIAYYTTLSYFNAWMGYPPGPPALPIVGNLHNLGTVPLANLTKLGHKYGSVFQILLGSQRAVVVSDITSAKEALLRRVNDFAGRPNVHSADIFSHNGKSIGFGSFSPMWKMQRRIAHGALKLYTTGMDQVEKIIIREIEEVSKLFEFKNGQPCNPHDTISLGIVNVICALTFHSRYSANDPEFRTIVELNNIFSTTLGLGNLVDIFPWLKHLPFESENIRRLKKAVEVRDKILHTKYKEQLETFQPGKIRGFTDALIKALKDNGKEETMNTITEEHILMSMADFFAAGAETSTSTLLWIFLFINNHPEVQKKLHQEIDEVVGRKRRPCLRDKKNMPYLEATIAEALRLRPVAPLGIPHKAIADTTLNGYKIPKDTTLILNLWAMHHDDRHWQNPSEFDPERFLDTNGNVLSPASMSYLPFSAGRRVCLGELLAKAELFLFVAQLMQQFTIENPPSCPVPSLEGDICLCLKPKPYQVCFKKRH